MAQVYNRPPLARQQYISKNGNAIIQLQDDRFCVNWRKTRMDDEYPRFSKLRQSFSEAWKDFEKFCRKHSGERPLVDQCELTYINHICRDEGWAELSEVGRVVTFVDTQGLQGGAPPTSLQANLTFDTSGLDGRMHIRLTHGRVQLPRETEALVLELTARGAPEKPGTVALRSWFGRARQHVLDHFREVTSEAIQQDTWERR